MCQRENARVTVDVFAVPHLISGPVADQRHDQKQESPLMFRINHIHLKSPDPKSLADWFVEAFKSHHRERHGESFRGPVYRLRL